jgi:hypothetical protein
VRIAGLACRWIFDGSVVGHGFSPARAGLPRMCRGAGLQACRLRSLAFGAALATVAAGVTVATQLPAAPSLTFTFDLYSNSVRVVAPLTADWQLGVATLRGTGSFEGGRVTGTFTDRDQPQDPRYPVRWISGSITGGRIEQEERTTRLILTVRIDSSSHPREECAPGLTGTLELQDSSALLPNGKSYDYAVLGDWSGRCSTHIHGWNNTDAGARTWPAHGGPPDGGQWAQVAIDGAGKVGTGEMGQQRGRRPSGEDVCRLMGQVPGDIVQPIDDVEVGCTVFHAGNRDDRLQLVFLENPQVLQATCSTLESSFNPNVAEMFPIDLGDLGFHAPPRRVAFCRGQYYFDGNLRMNEINPPTPARYEQILRRARAIDERVRGR